MNENDPERISLAICAAFVALPATTKVDRRAMARWLQSEFPGHPIEELIVHVERHCQALLRTCR